MASIDDIFPNRLDCYFALFQLVYGNLAEGDASFSRCQPLIDYPALLGVFTRYSRDIYGFRRISAKIRNLGTILNTDQQIQLEQIISEGADFGFKVPSGNPYVERQAAVLLYWFSVLKPFHLNYEKVAVCWQRFIMRIFRGNY